MRLYEEVEELKRLARELGDIFDDNGAPETLAELGWDADSECFRGRRVA
ncbi:hypothetical protein [Streptomyces variabilis]